MEDLKVSIQKISDITGLKFRKADEKDVERLSKFKLPHHITTFFSEYEPTRSQYIGEIKLLTIKEMIEENEDYVPGADVSPLGYIVFSLNGGGDAFCFDLNNIDFNGEPRIVFIPHSNDYEESNREEVEEYIEVFSENLNEFLFEVLTEANESIVD